MRYKSYLMLLAVAGMLALLLGQTVSAESDKMMHFYTLNAAGEHTLTAVYDVDLDKAFTAYAADKSSEWGTGVLYFKIGDDRMENIGSSEHFIEFLDANYDKMPVDRGDACDNTVTAVWVLTCPFDCTPTTDCEEWVHYVVTITCLDDPPCPPEEPLCLPFANRIYGFSTDPVPACVCVGGEGGVCTLADGAEVDLFWSDGPVCECAETASGACMVGEECFAVTGDSCAILGGTFSGAGTVCGAAQSGDHNIPTLSEWGLIIFSLLILSLVTVVVTRRRTATSAVGAGGSITISGPTFVPARFMKALVVTLSLAVVVLVTATIMSGSIPLRDIIGTILSAGIVAYIVHLWIVPKETE